MSRQLLFRLIFVLMICVLFWNAGVGICDYLSGYYSYKDDVVCEWLINYEGGMVRRGLLGQVLYWLFEIRPYPVAYIILCLFLVGVGALAAVMVKFFIKRGLSLFILPFPVCLYTFFGYRFLISRRDAWMLLLTFLFFWIYQKYVHGKSGKYLIVMNLLMICGTLIHESILFFAFPIVFCHYLWLTSHNSQNSLLSHIIKAVLVWLPSMIVPLVILLCPISQDVISSISHSWEPLFKQYPFGGTFALNEIYYEYLTQSLSWNYISGRLETSWLSSAIWIIPRWVFNLYLFVAIYYLTTRLNTIDLGWNKLKTYDSIQLSNIVIIQFLFLLPDMLFMSDDMARNITIWVVSSMSFFFFFYEKEYSPEWLNKCSLKIQNTIRNSLFLSHPITYLVILMTLPLEFHSGGVKMLIPIIPQEVKHAFISAIVG